MNQQSTLPGEYIPIQIKLAALWTAVMFCYVYGDYFELYVPHKVQGLLSGANMLDSPGKLFAASIVAVLPALMICGAVLLPARPNRVLNLVLGTGYTALMLLVGSLSLSTWRTFYVFLALLESVLTATIVWQAWHWKPAQTPAAPEPAGPGGHPLPDPAPTGYPTGYPAGRA